MPQQVSAAEVFRMPQRQTTRHRPPATGIPAACPGDRSAGLEQGPENA